MNWPRQVAWPGGWHVLERASDDSSQSAATLPSLLGNERFHPGPERWFWRDIGIFPWVDNFHFDFFHNSLHACNFDNLEDFFFLSCWGDTIKGPLSSLPPVYRDTHGDATYVQIYSFQCQLHQWEYWKWKECPQNIRTVELHAAIKIVFPRMGIKRLKYVFPLYRLSDSKSLKHLLLKILL